jgi:hypothetical protein
MSAAAWLLFQLAAVPFSCKSPVFIATRLSRSPFMQPEVRRVLLAFQYVPAAPAVDSFCRRKQHASA